MQSCEVESDEAERSVWWCISEEKDANQKQAHTSLIHEEQEEKCLITIESFTQIWDASDLNATIDAFECELAKQKENKARNNHR